MSTRPLRVLVVDDEPSYRLLLERAVAEQGHEVGTAADGVEAWERFSADHPDVVISDWLMPGLEGTELTRRIRSTPGGEMTYIILVTGQQGPAQLIAGMEAGADDYLTKPINLDDLRARLIAASRVTELHRQLAAQRAHLEELNAELAAMARRDPLTGLRNRLALREDLVQVRARASRHGHRYGLALLDVDHFKGYNDRYGHLAGDDVLVAVARALESDARQGDAFYRYGGEEFLCIFPEDDHDTIGEGAQAATERLRKAIEALGLPHETNPPIGVVTVSAGVAWFGDGDGRAVDATLQLADDALYRAKDGGRNRVESAPRTSTPG
jgi:two-component system cell cycle response regulator